MKRCTIEQLDFTR